LIEGVFKGPYQKIGAPGFYFAVMPLNFYPPGPYAK
jgi:hypothetical protein